MTLAVVTSYFNLNASPHRRRNYEHFRSAIEKSGVPLFTVEWAANPELLEIPADNLVTQVIGGDLLWQTERMLNLGIMNLPDRFDQVAWIDADLLIDEADWPDRVAASLAEWPIVQMFRTARLMPPDDAEPVPEMEIPGSIYCRQQGITWPDGKPRLGHAGFAWAARREVIQANGLYDHTPVGGGDKLLLFAMLGESSHPQLLQRQNEAMRAHYLDWVSRTREACEEKVGYTDLGLQHLWHGSLESRQYHVRHGIPLQHGYDPAVDQQVSASGAWEWSSNKPELHQDVAQYLKSRGE